MTIEENELQTQRLLGLYMILTSASFDVHELIVKLMSIRNYEFTQKRKMQYNEIIRLHKRLTTLYYDLLGESLDNAIVNVKDAKNGDKFDALTKDSNDLIRMLMRYRNAVVADRDNQVKIESQLKLMSKGIELFHPAIYEQFNPLLECPKELLL